ncbi:hypothetical protein DB347_12740 [Opitutaceae bacterium EW11]|nr:hypothetical protein DB347_12740 [Opitutaceae bacterium EW11]
MTTATPSAIRDPLSRYRRGFTLVEVMIATALMVVITGGVLSTALFMSKGGLNASHYSDMEQQARRGLEIFARDVRMANKITWIDTNQMVLRVVTSSSGLTTDVQYIFDSAAHTFTRNVGGTSEVLFSGVTNSDTDYPMSGYKLTGDPVTPTDIATSPAQASANTKEIQLNLTCNRTRTGMATSTSRVISARFILRNKLVTSI